MAGVRSSPFSTSGRRRRVHGSFPIETPGAQGDWYRRTRVYTHRPETQTRAAIPGTGEGATSRPKKYVLIRTELK